MIEIALAQSDQEILNCFALMQELRPHLIESEFVERVRRQQQSGYQLVALVVALADSSTDFTTAPVTVLALAGFRLSECLAWGRFLYVDDLVTQSLVRSQGYGEQLFGWLIHYAQQHHCQAIQLDSGVQRFAAHRFYFRQRMEITSYHFSRSLPQPVR